MGIGNGFEFNGWAERAASKLITSALSIHFKIINVLPSDGIGGILGHAFCSMAWVALSISVIYMNSGRPTSL